MKADKGKTLVWGMGGGLHGEEAGLYSNSRGEGRWTSNVAILFRKYGYSVDIYAGGRVGMTEHYKGKQHDVNFLHNMSELGSGYDIFFEHFPSFNQNPQLWEKISPLIEKSLCGTFWPEGFKILPPEKGQIVTPHLSPVPNIKTLPYCYIDKIAPPRFKNKTIVWTARSPFNTYKGTDHFLVNLFYLKTTLRAANLGYKVIILCAGPSTHSFYYNDPSGYPSNLPLLEEVKRLVVELKKISDKVTFFNYMPQDQFAEQLKKASVVISADGIGSLPYCLMHSLAPVIFSSPYEELLPRFVFDKYGGSCLYTTLTQRMIEDRIFRLLTDEIYYNEYVLHFQKYGAVYTTEEALALLNDIVQN